MDSTTPATVIYPNAFYQHLESVIIGISKGLLFHFGNLPPVLDARILTSTRLDDGTVLIDSHLGLAHFSGRRVQQNLEAREDTGELRPGSSPSDKKVRS